MEKNEEINSVHSQTKSKNKKFLVIGAIVAVVVVVAGVGSAITIVTMNANKDKEAAAKPKLVAPAKVLTGIKAANDSAKAAYDQHTSARSAFQEEPTRLTQ